MAYFIFQKNLPNIEGTIYRVAENDSDLNGLNINKDDYKIIEDNNVNFDDIKSNKIYIVKYDNDDKITFIDGEITFNKLGNLQNYVNNFKNQLKCFLNSNSNHLSFTKWNSYYNQLNDLNYDSFIFPLTLSLEQYFKNNNKPYFTILQLP